MVGSDVKLLREVARFTADKLMLPCTQEKMSVLINVKDYKKGWDGECQYVGNFDGIRKFKVTISNKLTIKRAKKPFVRLRVVIETLVHEMIHVKQYMCNELYDYADGSTRYKGNKFDSNFEYWDAPWEIEAYGRTQGIIEQFKEQYYSDGSKRK
jgi:hypothetical protein